MSIKQYQTEKEKKREFFIDSLKTHCIFTLMNYTNERDRKTAGVCIKCEGSPVTALDLCAACHEKRRYSERIRIRRVLKCEPRKMWEPDKQIFVLIDDRVAYDAVRAQIAQEIGSGANSRTVCEKYKMSRIRLRKICMEYGVTVMPRKGGERVKTPARLALEAAVLADARAGMRLRDLKAKYPGHEVRYICLKAGVTIVKLVVPAVSELEGQRCEATRTRE